MRTEDAATEKSQAGPKWRGMTLYWILLSAQGAGASILLMNMIPLYRLMALDFPSYRPDVRPSWAIVGILLLQTAYWLRVRLQPPLPRTRSIVLGHVVAFVARIGFVAATAAFTAMFLNRFEALRDMNYPPFRALGVLMIFFALFCWTLELERLARALQASNHESGNAQRGSRRRRTTGGPWQHESIIKP